jgi:hypothetical protein
MRPLTAANWAGTIGGMTPPQYRFSDDLAWVEIGGAVATDASTGNMNNVVFFTIPANYRPQLSQRILINSVADGSASPTLLVSPTGTFSFTYLPASIARTQIGIQGRYVLDDQNGFIQV